MSNKNNMKELLSKDAGGLGTLLEEHNRRLFDLRCQAVTEKLENPTQIGKTRREIARIKTILRSRELEQQRTAATQQPV